MIYLDNAATTYPKPKKVIKECMRCIRDYCGNPGRSSHSLSMKTSEKIFEARESVAELLGMPDKCENVVFTQNATYALNFAIKCSVTPRSHILVSDVEHNSVIRPLNAMRKTHAIDYSMFSSDDVEGSIEELIRPETKYLISTLGSNVTGKEISLSVLSRISKKYGLYLIVDSSQIIGHKRIDLEKTPCDVLCAPGHKALFGIQGSGFAFFRDYSKADVLIHGGSGNQSISEEMPDNLPERFEAGTLPSPSIISLLEGIKFINNQTLEFVENKISEISNLIYERLSSIKKVRIYAAENGIISFNLDGVSSHLVSEKLNSYRICTRAGLHCAPSAHRKLGTLESGTVRASLSCLNERADADRLYKAMKEISSEN